MEGNGGCGLSSGERRVFSKYSVIDKVRWEKLLGEIGEEPPLPPNFLTMLESPSGDGSMTWGEVFIFFVVPERLNGAPYTINCVKDRIKCMTDRIRFFSFPDHSLHHVPSVRTYWGMMSREVVKQSLGGQYEHLVRDLKKIGYRPPSVNEAATGVITHFLLTEEILLKDHYTQTSDCVEFNGGSARVLVGDCKKFLEPPAHDEPVRRNDEFIGMVAFREIRSLSIPSAPARKNTCIIS